MARGTAIPTKRGGRSNYSTFMVKNPGKGLNNLISDALIDDRESSDLDNIQFVESGAPSKADGYEQLGDDLSNNPRGLGYYVDTSGNKKVMTVDGTALKYLNGSTWTTIAGASYSSSAQINFTQARGKIYIWDGTSGGTVYDGSTLSRPGTMPSAKFSIFYQNYHICAGTGTQKSRIYISVLTDASDFTNDTSVADPTPDNSTDVPGATVFAGTGTGSAIAQFVDIAKDDGDKITGFGKFGDALIIFKENSIYQLTFDSTGLPIIETCGSSYGCVSHRSIDNMENDLVFMTRNGMYLLGNEPNFTTVIRTNELSARVHNTIAAINPAQYEKVTAEFNLYTMYIGVPTAQNTNNTATITYDRRYGAFSVWTHVKPEAFCTYIDSNNEMQLIFTSADSAKVYQMTPGTYSADGSAISASWSSKAFDLGDFSTYKRWIDVTIYFRQLSGTVNIDVVTDNGQIARSASVSGLSSSGIGSDMWGDAFFGGNTSTSSSTTSSSTNNVPYRLRIGIKARSVKLVISNDRNNENFVVLGFVFALRNYSHFVYPSSLRIQ